MSAVVKAVITKDYSTTISARDLPEGSAVLVVYDATGLHVYSLASDDPGIPSLDTTLLDEQNPVEEE